MSERERLSFCRHCSNPIVLWSCCHRLFLVEADLKKITDKECYSPGEEFMWNIANAALQGGEKDASQ